MARKLYYKIIADGKNEITNEEWESILRLQHWYNSEFIWTAGRLGFKMYAVFPNTDLTMKNVDALEQIIRRRRRELKEDGLSENETIQQLEAEGLIIIQKGGYFDHCIASGFTRVAGNEFNAYLVCEFLLKVSLIAPRSVISVYDEGEFIKSKNIMFHIGNVILQLSDTSKLVYFQEMVNNHHVFSIIDPAKYDNFPKFKSSISDFNELDFNERLAVLKDWNWLGFGDNFDIHGDDVQGSDLNKKVLGFHLEIINSKS